MCVITCESVAFYLQCVCVCVSVCSVLGDTRDELQCDSESRLRCRARGAL